MISLPNERPAVSVFGLYHLLRKTSELFRGLILKSKKLPGASR